MTGIKETQVPGTYLTGGNAEGISPFSISLGAPFTTLRHLNANVPPPEIAIVDLDHASFAPKLENYLFFQLFCTAPQEGCGAELARLNNKIMAYERHGVRAPAADLEQRDRIVSEAQKKGFEALLTPGVPVFLCRKLTVFVVKERQRERMLDLLQQVFVHRDKEWFASQLKEYREAFPDYCQLTDAAIARIVEGFENARSFVASPGVFFDQHAGAPYSDDHIRKFKLAEVVDVRTLSTETQEIAKGTEAHANSISVRLEGDDLVFEENGGEFRAPLAAARQDRDDNHHWREKGIRIFTETLRQDDGLARLINLGTGDALYIGTGEDFTNFCIVHQGRLAPIDPSEKTVRNLIDLEWLERIEFIYLSHAHYDHISGILELACRFIEGMTLPRFKVMCASAVWLQMREVLSAMTGKAADSFEELFERMKPTRICSAAGLPYPDGDVEAMVIEEGVFEGFAFEMMRTFRHPMPTYALKAVTPGGAFAYLVDSAMPPMSVEGKRHERYDDFVAFFGVKAGVDLLIADAADVEEHKFSVHMSPAELLRVFPDHAKRGALWSVHSPLPQKARDIRRFEPFDVIEIERYEDRRKKTEFFANQLLALGAFQNRHFQVSWEQAERIARVAGSRIYSKGERILEKKDDVRNPENNKVHIILRGEVSVAEEGAEIKEGEKLGPGDLFGERAIFGAEVHAMGYWQIPERRRAKVLTRHEFESGAYYTWNPGLTENDIEDEFAREPELKDMLVTSFRETQKLHRTRTAIVLSDQAEALDIKAAEFYKIFEHFVYSEADFEREERDEKIRKTLGSLVLSSASASRRMRMDDFVALVETNHLTRVMEPIKELAAIKREGDHEKIKAYKWPESIFANWTRLDPVSRVIDANLSAFLNFARVFHDQYVEEIEIAPYLDPTRATPGILSRLVEDGALDGNSDRVKAYIARYTNPKKHVKLQKQDVLKLRSFVEALADRPRSRNALAEKIATENADKLMAYFEEFAATKDVLSSLYAEWDVLMNEVNHEYAKSAREPYKEYLARLQTKAIANILTILLYLRTLHEEGTAWPKLDEILLWIHAAWSLDNDWAEQAGLDWEELEATKPGDIKKDWVALIAVIDQLEFKNEFEEILRQGRQRFGGELHHKV